MGIGVTIIMVIVVIIFINTRVLWGGRSWAIPVLTSWDEKEGTIAFTTQKCLFVLRSTLRTPDVGIGNLVFPETAVQGDGFGDFSIIGS